MARSIKQDKSQTEDKDADLAKVKAQFLDAETTNDPARREAETCRLYFDGHQWSAKEEKALEDRGQPVITDNKIKDKVETLLGFERESRRDPKGYPRNPSDEQSAEAVTDSVRYVSDENQFDYVRSDAAEDLFVEAIGAIEITVDKKLPKNSKVPNIRVKHILRDRVYYDPHSRRCDFSDARFKGIVTWMDAEEAKAKWKGKAAIIDEAIDLATSTNQAFDDRPLWAQNTANRKRVQILDHHYIEKGVWYRCVFCASGFLESPRPSEYVNDEDEPISSIEIQAMYRQRSDGAPYSMIRRYKDLQDDWNKRRSKSLHLLNTNQVIIEEGMLNEEQVEAVRKEAAKPDGVIQSPGGVKLSLEKNLDLAQGHVMLMEQTGRALDATGPNQALEGKSGSISGIAKQVDTQAGLISIDRPFDAVRFLTIRTYRQIWFRIRQFWTQEHWIRVRDDEHTRFVALNRDLTRAEAIAEQLAKENIPDEEKEAMLAELASNPVYRERVRLNDVTQLDVDVILDESPNTITVQHEEFTMLIELAKTGVVQIPPKVIIEASQFRNKQKLIDMMEGTNDPNAQAMAALQQKMGELEMAVKEAQLIKTHAEASKAEAAAEESRIDAAIKVGQYPEGATPKTSVTVN